MSKLAIPFRQGTAWSAAVANDWNGAASRAVSPRPYGRPAKSRPLDADRWRKRHAPLRRGLRARSPRFPQGCPPGSTISGTACVSNARRWIRVRDPTCRGLSERRAAARPFWLVSADLGDRTNSQRVSCINWIGRYAAALEKEGEVGASRFSDFIRLLCIAAGRNLRFGTGQ